MSAVLEGTTRFEAEQTSCDNPKVFNIIALPNIVKSLALHISSFVCNLWTFCTKLKGLGHAILGNFV